jgi:hypothetical protein
MVRRDVEKSRRKRDKLLIFQRVAQFPVNSTNG